MKGRRINLFITPDHAGKTVDTLLRHALNLSGTAVKRAKAVPVGITLDGLPVDTRTQVKPGQTLSVFVGDTAPASLSPCSGQLEIVYEDEDLLVINKAPGMPVHPSPGHSQNTLGNLVAAYYQEHGIVAAFHPVNRLDRQTSGLMAIAKHAHAHHLLIDQLQSRIFRRSYLAICEGVPSPLSGVIDAPIGRAPDSAIRRQVRPDGAPARTRYTVLSQLGGRALVQVEPETGRTHQIRVHFAHIGHPLTGDFLYGTENKELISRPALHSANLMLVHPITDVILVMVAPLPQDMRNLLSLSSLTEQVTYL